MAPRRERSTIHELFNELGSASQRLIKICIGDPASPECIQLQQQLLEEVSEYFVAAFQRGHAGDDQSDGAVQIGRFEEGRSGIFKFPKDPVDIWKILAQWIIRREVPKALLKENPVLAIRCWLLGDRYLVKEFQDSVMLCLLEELEPTEDKAAYCGKLSKETVRFVYENTVEGSNLRKVVVERIVYQTYTRAGSMEHLGDRFWNDISDLDGIDFLPHLMHSTYLWDEGDRDRYTHLEGGRSSWNNYMEGSAKKT